MVMAFVWTGMIAVSILCAIATGRTDALAQAAVTGAGSAVQLAIGICGMLCLWSGIMEVMRRAGLLEALSRGLKPLLKPLFPQADDEARQAISVNMAANFLGLGNAATPPGLLAASRLQRLSGQGETASDGFCLLVVINTASLQLIPSTVAAVRAAGGAAAPFDILPAVWFASVCSMTVAIVSARLFARLSRRVT